MTINDLKAEYLKSSSKTSELTRNVNYSCIALVWILCGQDLSKVTEYKFVLLFLLLSLLCDFFQYLWKTLTVCIDYKIKYNKIRHDSDDVEFSSYIQYGTWFFLTLKIVFAFVAVVNVFIQIWELVPL